MIEMKMHRITRNLKPRHQTWRTESVRVVALSLIGFACYLLVHRLLPRSRAPIRNTLGTRYGKVFLQQTQQFLEQLEDITSNKSFGESHLPNINKLHHQPLHSEPAVILIWKAMEFQMELFKIHFEYMTEPECGGCQVTINRGHVATCAALVHFNAPDLQYNMDVPDPRFRNPNQTYVFWSRETPSKTFLFHDALKDTRFDAIFNLTMNFRIDSDIIDYFGNPEHELRFFWKWRIDTDWFKPLLKRKTGLAIWIVSNCNSTYGATERMKYAKSLIDAGLNLTTYGNCFKEGWVDDIRLEILAHKFYMSLENSLHCPDYISEKFWRNGIRAHAVPVVWGPTKEDVERIAPPKSFIHSEDFKTPKELVDYLNYLDKNDTAYREYHEWRNMPFNKTILDEDIEPNYKSALCRLCKRITKTPLKHKTIPSVHDWLYGTRYVDDLCLKEL